MAAADPVVTQRQWYYSSQASVPKMQPGKGYLIFLAGQEDFQRVLEWYQQHPVKGMGLRKVEIIHNPMMARGFEARIALLEERFGNAAFTPKWASECKTKVEEQQRKSALTLLDTMTKPHKDPLAPHVTLLPMWHGTKSEVIESIFKAGFANLSLVDPGYFGRGLYGTGEAEYAYRVYSKGALLINWVSFFSAYPVVKGDMQALLGKGNRQNYDAHFAPVVPANPNNPNEAVYYPCNMGQKHTYTELAVFDASQVLPRYLVELQPDLPQALCKPLIASADMYEEDEKESASVGMAAFSPVLPKREVKLLGMHPSFIGRKLQLQTIEKHLLNKPGVNALQLIGSPGIGKSELAVAFGNIYLERFSFIWTIEAQTKHGMLHSYQTLAKQLGIYFDPKDKLKVVASSVHRFLEVHAEKKPYLLIFDNAEKMPDLPARGNGAIIITSREKLSREAVIALEPFSEKEAQELFQKIFKQVPDEFALQLAQNLDYYPLALTQAFHYIQQTPDMSSKKYLMLVQENQKASINELPIDRYQMSIAATWEITFQKLKQEYPDALEWLQISAFLSPDGFPATWIELHIEKTEVNSYTRQIKKGEILKVLLDHGMIRYHENNDLIFIHRFEQTIIKDTLPAPQKTAIQKAIFEFLESFAKNLDHEDPKDWNSLSLLKPTLLHLEKENSLNLELADLLDKLGRWELVMGRDTDALKIFERVLSLRQTIYPHGQHPSMGASWNFIGEAWEGLGEYQKALGFHQQALNLRKTLYPDETHPAIAESLFNLGFVCECLGEYQKALSFFEQSLELRRKLYPHGKHRDIVCSLHGLGLVWARLGNSQKALKFHEEALELRVALYPDGNHPAISLSLTALGMIRYDLGDYKKALPLFEQRLESLRALYSDGKHPAIALILTNIGATLTGLNENQKALGILEKALELKKVLYPNGKHPEMAVALNWLGVVWDNLGNPQKAIEFHEQSLDVYKALYPDGKHPQFASSLSCLGRAWSSLKENRKAIDYDEQALEMRRVIYPDGQHPHIASSLNDLGHSYFGLGAFQKAIVFYEKALDIFRALYPDGANVAIAGSFNNLGNAWKSLKEYQKAIEFYEKGLEIFRMLDSTGKHPTIANLSYNLGNVWYVLAETPDQYRKAIRFQEKALKAYRALYPDGKHQGIQISLNSIGNGLFRLGDYQKAITFYEKALDINRNRHPNGKNEDCAEILNSLGNTWRDFGDYQKAVELFEQALELRTKLLGEEHANTLLTKQNLEEACNMLRQKNKKTPAQKIKQFFSLRKNPDEKKV